MKAVSDTITVDLVGGSSNGRRETVAAGQATLRVPRRRSVLDALDQYDIAHSNLPPTFEVASETYVRETIYFSGEEPIVYFRHEHVLPRAAVALLLTNNRQSRDSGRTSDRDQVGRS